jgi:tyrosinase
MTVTATAPRQRAPARLSLRKNIALMSEGEIADFRRAMKKLMAISDNRGYSYFAGWHGVPFGWCEHHTVWFLPWHRAYLYRLELALQRQVPGVTLPWWDWTRGERIPREYRLKRVDGKANDLASAKIVVFGGQSRGRTFRRDPDAPAAAPGPPYRDRYRQALEATSFQDFTSRIEGIHDDVHVWVGGTMSNIDWAAYDPLFYAHHAMVDRAWRIWQHRNPGANPPANILDRPFRSGGPSGLTPRDVLDVKQLGYDYAATENKVAGPG